MVVDCASWLVRWQGLGRRIAGGGFQIVANSGLDRFQTTQVYSFCAFYRSHCKVYRFLMTVGRAV